MKKGKVKNEENEGSGKERGGGESQFTDLMPLDPIAGFREGDDELNRREGRGMLKGD